MKLQLWDILPTLRNISSYHDNRHPFPYSFTGPPDVPWNLCPLHCLCPLTQSWNYNCIPPPNPTWWSLLREERPGQRVLQEKEPVSKLPTLLLWEGHIKSITKGLGSDNRQHSMPWTKRVPITHQPTTRKSDCRASVLWEQKVQASLTKNQHTSCPEPGTSVTFGCLFCFSPKESWLQNYVLFILWFILWSID